MLLRTWEIVDRDIVFQFHTSDKQNSLIIAFGHVTIYNSNPVEKLFVSHVRHWAIGALHGA